MSDIKLGVQLFTLRDKCKNAEDFETTLKFLDSIGCHVIQISAIGDIHPEKVAELVDKYKMDVCVTHKPYDRMKNDLEALVHEHDLIHCDNIVNRKGSACMAVKLSGAVQWKQRRIQSHRLCLLFLLLCHLLHRQIDGPYDTVSIFNRNRKRADADLLPSLGFQRLIFHIKRQPQLHGTKHCTGFRRQVFIYIKKLS